MDNQDLWVDLECDAWTWDRQQNNKSTNSPPIKSRRNLWLKLTQADKDKAVTAINRFRNDVASVDSARPAFEQAKQDADIDILQVDAGPTQTYRDALIRAADSAANLATVRADIGGNTQYATITANGLAAAEARYRDESTRVESFMKDLAARLKRRWDEIQKEAGKHPFGTPPPSRDDSSGSERKPHAPSDVWMGGFPLGKGGQGRPVLYITQNRHGQVADRLVVKDTTWMTAQHIYNGVRDDNGDEYPIDTDDPQFCDREYKATLPVGSTLDDEIPAEVSALLRVNGKLGEDSIVALRNWARIYRNGRTTWYRTYMEWCGYGDLWELSRKYHPYKVHQAREGWNKRYWEAKQANEEFDEPQPDDEAGDDAEKEWLPEPFLWSVFESLATACLLMQRGAIVRVEHGIKDGTTAADPPWSEAWHLDFKPGNIFLGENRSGLYQGYPQAKLGDFGHCIIHPHDPNIANRINCDVYYVGSTGTEYCQAPEQLNLGTNGHQYLSSKTDVWGLGIVMWSFMHSAFVADIFTGDISQDSKSTPYIARTSDDGENSQPQDLSTLRFPEYLRNRYSKRLRHLIRDCLKYDPDDRPTFDDILASIRKAVAKKGVDQGLREAEWWDERWTRDEFALRLGNEKWGRGKILREFWPEDEGLPRPKKRARTEGSPDKGLGFSYGTRMDFEDDLEEWPEEEEGGEGEEEEGGGQEEDEEAEQQAE